MLSNFHHNYCIFEFFGFRQNLFIKLATLTTSQKPKHDLFTEEFLIGWNISNQNKNNLPDSSSEQVTVHISRFNVQNDNIQIAVRDRGSCSTIRRVRLGFVVCPFIRKNFIEYPRTISGKIMEGLTIDGRCISGAALLNHREIPKLICQTDGIWYYEAIKSFHSGGGKDFDSLSKNNFLNHLDRPCECMPGFGVLNEDNLMDQLCERKFIICFIKVIRISGKNTLKLYIMVLNNCCCYQCRFIIFYNLDIMVSIV